jgi:hypothetical protein
MIIALAGCATAPLDTTERIESTSMALAPTVAVDNGPIGPIGPWDPSDTTTTIKGTLERIFVGPLRSTGLGAGYQYSIRTAPRTTTRISLSEDVIQAAGGIRRILGNIVTVKGLPGRVFTAQSIAVNGTFTERPSPTANQIGTKKWLIIPCRFSDLPNPDPHSSDYFRSLMSNQAPGVSDYWSKASRGQLAINSTVAEWADLPTDMDGGGHVSPSSNTVDLMNLCLATTPLFFDETFHNLLLVFSHNLDHAAAAGMDEYGRSVGVLSPIEFTHQASVNQAMGLVMGLDYSGTAPGRYDSPWDVMSQGFGLNLGRCRSLTPSLGCTSALPAAEHALSMGWAPASEVATVPANGTSTVDLDFVGNTPMPGHASVVHLPIDDTRTITLEARNQVDGSYDNAVPQTGIVVHTHDSSGINDRFSLRLEDAFPNASTGQWCLYPWPAAGPISCFPLQSGTYTNNALKIRVGFVQKPFGYTLTVARGPVLRVSTSAGSATISGPGISCSTSGGGCSSLPRSFGDALTLTATAANGYRLTGWTGCDSVSGLQCNITMDRSKGVVANLKLKPEPPEDRCVCRPTWPLYKCRQICGNRP